MYAPLLLLRLLGRGLLMLLLLLLLMLLLLLTLLQGLASGIIPYVPTPDPAATAQPLARPVPQQEEPST
jgi:hypothetical protein